MRRTGCSALHEVNYNLKNGKIMIIYITVGLIKNYFYIKLSYFPPYGHSKHEIKVELNLSTNATKSDFKNASGVDKSQFAKKYDLKSKVDRLDVDKLKSKIDNSDIGKLETALDLIKVI